MPLTMTLRIIFTAEEEPTGPSSARTFEKPSRVSVSAPTSACGPLSNSGAAVRAGRTGDMMAVST